MPALPGLCSTAHAPKGRSLRERRRQNRSRMEVFARREVIVSSGTANTAKLLQMSGVGPAWLLADLGVPVIVDLPVGENLRDHYSARVVARVKNVRTMNEMSHGFGLLGQNRALDNQAGPIFLAVAPSGSYIGSGRPRTRCASPTCKACSVPPAISKDSSRSSMTIDLGNDLIWVWQHRPERQYRLRSRARSVDLFVDPIIQPNYLERPDSTGEFWSRA